jgi:Protein of unknown function (DUF2384)
MPHVIVTCQKEAGDEGGKSPLEIARSEKGAAFVAQMLAQMDWGAAA